MTDGLTTILLALIVVIALVNTAENIQHHRHVKKKLSQMIVIEEKFDR